MKELLCFFGMLGLIALTACQTSPRESLDATAARRLKPVRIEFTRAGRPYEEGDAFFAMVNQSQRVFWFDGNGPESPAYRLKAGAAVAAERTIPRADNTAVFERMPLSPGETRYFEINTRNATSPISVGVSFYPSRSDTNGISIWSSPITVPPKPH